MLVDLAFRLLFRDTDNSFCINGKPLVTQLFPISSIFHRVRAVIFDLDGTLIDSLGIWNAVDVALVKQLGHSSFSTDELCHFREKALISHAREENPYVGFCADLGRLCGSSLSATEIHKMRYQISRRLLREEMRLRPGAAKVVKKIRSLGMETAIATTTKRANIDIYDQQNTAIMSELKISEHFPIILSRENVHSIKPDPEIYLKALQRLQLPPSECLVFEDSLAGVMAARSAGIPVCSIEEPWSLADLPAIQRLVQKHFRSWQEVWIDLENSSAF